MRFPEQLSLYPAQRHLSESVRSVFHTVSDTGIKNNSNSQPSYNANKKTYTGKSFDPYDAEEYDDPDDFADEWAEEFGDGDYDDGYEDAYDYWEDEME